MAGFFSKLKAKMRKSGDDDLFDEADKDYVELDTQQAATESGVNVRFYVLEDFADVKTILDTFREGNTIAMVNIKPLKDKDMIELKRAINKIKKTTDALEGDVAGFGDDYIVATPKFAKIYRTGPKARPSGNSQRSDEEEMQ